MGDTEIAWASKGWGRRMPKLRARESRVVEEYLLALDATQAALF